MWAEIGNARVEEGNDSEQDKYLTTGLIESSVFEGIGHPFIEAKSIFITLRTNDLLYLKLYDEGNETPCCCMMVETRKTFCSIPISE